MQNIVLDIVTLSFAILAYLHIWNRKFVDHFML